VYLQRNQTVCEGDNFAKDYFADEILFRHRHFGGWLAGFRQRRGFTSFDIQMVTPATKSLGAIGIPRREYLHRLSAAGQ
jgi:hypothetical protein